MSLTCFLDYVEALFLTFFFCEAEGGGGTYSKYVTTGIMFTTTTVRQHSERN